MHKKFRWLLGVALFGLISCQPISPSAAPLAATATSEATTMPHPTRPLTLDTSKVITQENIVSQPIPTDNPQVAQAIKDLARRLSVSLDKITVARAEAVTWPDGGLGCPQPGMAYIQVQQDGMRIVLNVDGKEYHYHSGERRPPFLCENPTPGS